MTRTSQRWAATAGLTIVVACQGCQGPPSTAAGVSDTAPLPDNPRKILEDMKAARFREATVGLEFRADGVIVTEPLAGRTPDEAMALVADGNQKLETNRRSGALAAYVRAIRTDPDNALGYDGLGRALVTKGKVEYALAAYLTAARLDATLVAAPFGAAMTLARLGRFEDAIDQMLLAVELDPANTLAHQRLAIWYYYLDDTDTAWQHVLVSRDLGQALPGQFIALLEAKSRQRPSIVN